MLSGDSAVIDTEEELTLIQPSTNVDFTKLPTYLDNQISKAILGANLTSDIKEGSYAAAKTHNEIREDLAANDGKILEFVMNKTIGFFKEINNYKGEIEAKIYDEDAPNAERASRDKTLFDMGFVPTAKYISKIYNIELDEKAIKERLSSDLKANKRVLKNANKPIDRFEKATSELKIDDSEIEAALSELIAQSETYEQAFDRLYELYDLPFDELEKYMFRAIANAQMIGYADE